ncbi:MAG: Gfo/Idh/MocA family oxidoreductase [Acidobacteria bacterium]|nr:Gfo/Idh/MocA family oxidoreductase [Acidobacteriota bacterium]
MSHNTPTRRHFFIGPLLAGAVPAAGYGSAASLKMLGYKSPNEKLNIAAIGAGGKGASDIAGCATENIVALADVDWARAERTFKLHEKAPKYKDFRQMLDKEGRNIDAVIIATPDHMHGIATMAAMERGKGVYTQKPLTRTVWEARALTQAAAKFKVPSQMGNQGYSNEGTRQCAEMIWAGEIGAVTEVHAWTNRPVWPQGIAELPKEDAVPSTLDWDLWLGGSAQRPYASAYLPFNWRGWLDFGSGSLGDMACHILGAPNMALQLGAPVAVECVKKAGNNKHTHPKSSVIRFDFPARGSMRAVKVFWYDGAVEPPFRPNGLGAEEVLGDLPRRPAVDPAKPAANASDRLNQNVNRAIQRGSNGSLFIGEKGLITTGTYGENTRLLPAEKMKDYKMPPQFLTRSPGHYRDWIRACKGGGRACSDFSIAGPFTEWIALGVLATRFEGKLEWDSAKMRVTNNNAANEYLKPKFRKGWQMA